MTVPCKKDMKTDCVTNWVNMQYDKEYRSFPLVPRGS